MSGGLEANPGMSEQLSFHREYGRTQLSLSFQSHPVSSLSSGVHLRSAAEAGGK
jgi:hypothetical protein